MFLMRCGLGLGDGMVGEGREEGLETFPCGWRVVGRTGDVVFPEFLVMLMLGGANVW